MSKGFWWSAAGLRLRAQALLGLSMVMLVLGVVPGLAGHGWPGFAAMAAAFVLARLLAKPWLLQRLGQPGGPARLSADVAGQVVVALALFWLGYGIAVATGWQPALGFWLPPAMALAAGSLSRLIWRPMPPEWDGLLDEAIAGITGAGPGPAAADDSPEVAALNAALDALPAQGAQHHALVDAVLAALSGMSPEDLRMALHTRILDTTTERDLRALVVAHTDPYVAQHFRGQRDLEEIFDLIVEAGDVAAMTSFIGGVTAVLDSVPEACHDLPTPHRLRKLAGDLPPDTAAGLIALAARVQSLREEHPEA